MLAPHAVGRWKKKKRQKNCRAMGSTNLPRTYYSMAFRRVKEILAGCQTSFKMSPFLPRLKCPLTRRGRGCRWGRWSGAVRRSGRGPSGAGGRRPCQQPPSPLLHLALRVTLVGMVQTRAGAWARIRHMHGPAALRGGRARRTRNFAKGHLLPAIAHLQVPIGAFVDHRLGLPGTVAAPRRQQLQKASLMPHHPVVAHPVLGPQPENGV